MVLSCPISSRGPQSCSSVPVRFPCMPPCSYVKRGMIGTKAVNSLVFAEYLNRVLWNATRGDDAPTEIIPDWVINATAVAVVCFVVMLVVGTRSLGPRAAVILTCMKVRVTVWRSERISSLLTKFVFVKVLALVCLSCVDTFPCLLAETPPPSKAFRDPAGVTPPLLWPPRRKPVSRSRHQIPTNSSLICASFVRRSLVV